MASMYITFIKDVYMPIVTTQYSDDQVFMHDFSRLKIHFFDALDKLDLELSNYLRRYIFQEPTDERPTFNDKDIADAQHDFKMQRKIQSLTSEVHTGVNKYFYYPLNQE